MKNDQSIYSNKLNQRGHTIARIQFSPDWSKSKPFACFMHGTAMAPAHETLNDAKRFLASYGIPLDSWPEVKESE